MEDLFAGIFGETDEDTKKANLLTAAYTFFQIAAGASPNALTNIANGVTLGMEELMKRQQADKDREDNQMMALQQVLGEEAADKKFARDLQIAGVKAGVGSRDYRNSADAYQDAKAEFIKMTKEPFFAKQLRDQGVKDFSSWAAGEALRTVQESYPSSALKGTPLKE